MTEETRNRMADEIAATLSEHMTTEIDVFLMEPSKLLELLYSAPKRTDALVREIFATEEQA